MGFIMHRAAPFWKAYLMCKEPSDWAPFRPMKMSFGSTCLEFMETRLLLI